jgi:dihydrodipicolinate synthase/N-acetylneuraminate lyase
MTGWEVAGVLPVFQTPFLDDETLDRATFERQLDWLFEQGADGVVFGMVSEVLRLSSEERDEVATLTARACRGRGASIISVGAESTATALRHARHAVDVGADAVMAAPPMLSRPTDDEIVRYYTAIAEAISVPVIIQDASGYVGFPLPVEVQATLFAELGDRAMFKPESPPIGPRLTQLLDATDQKAKVFEGTGGLYLIDSYRRGVVGTMPAGDLIWALSPLWKALVAGDYDRAYAIAGPLAQIVSLQTSLDSFVAIEKRLLVEQGVFVSSTMRGPTQLAVDTAMDEEVDRLVVLLRSAVGHG